MKKEKNTHKDRFLHTTLRKMKITNWTYISTRILIGLSALLSFVCEGSEIAKGQNQQASYVDGSQQEVNDGNESAETEDKRARDTIIASGNEALAALKDVYKEMNADDLLQIVNKMGFVIGKSDQEDRELKGRIDNIKRRAERTGQDARALLAEEIRITQALAPAFGPNRIGARLAAEHIAEQADVVRENNRTGATSFSPEEVIQYSVMQYYNAEALGQYEQHINKDPERPEKQLGDGVDENRLQRETGAIEKITDPSARMLKVKQVMEEERGTSRKSQMTTLACPQ